MEINGTNCCRIKVRLLIPSDRLNLPINVCQISAYITNSNAEKTKN